MRIEGAKIVVASFVDGHKVPVLKVGEGEAHVFVDGSPSQYIKVFWNELTRDELANIAQIRRGK